jgi:anaphase-promoting complex subunit 7
VSGPSDSTPSVRLDESLTKFKMGKCYAFLNEWRASLAELETIPARARTLRVTLALAEAYKRTGYDRASVACYKECLRMNPFAVEAMEALADAGAAAAELARVVPPAPDSDQSLDASRMILQNLVVGRCALRSGNVGTAGEAYRRLARAHPEDSRVSLALARVARVSGDPDAALDFFRRRRALDPHAAEGADEFAELLRYRMDEGEAEGYGDTGSATSSVVFSPARDAEDEHGLGGYGVLSSDYGTGRVARHGTCGELRELTRETMVSNPERCEAWIVGSTYWSARGQLTRALGYAEKALRLDDLKISAHLAKGHLCLRLRRPEDAVVSFRRAATLWSSATPSSSSVAEGGGGNDRGFSVAFGVAARAGIVAAYLQRRRRKEALAAAKEALALAPRSAAAHALVGDAYFARGVSIAPTGASASAEAKARAEKAKKHFKRALDLNPADARIALAMSEALRACGESDAAIQTLRLHLETYASGGTRARVACHCALGAALASARMLADAAGEYQRALGLDPENEPARRGVARVERLMKGQDPDARDDADEDEDVDEEDNEDDDEDGNGDEEDEEGDGVLFE